MTSPTPASKPPAHARGQLRRRRPRACGFTLIEVLVALVVMAVLAGLGWRGIDAMVRSRDVANAASVRTSRLAAIVAQWQDDLIAVHESGVVPAMRADGVSLRLVRRDAGGLRVVVWSLRDGVWRRWAGPVVDRVGALRRGWFDALQLLGNEPGQTTLAEGVGGWQLYFWRGGTWSHPQSSAGTDSTAGAASAAAPSTYEPPPGGVRLVIDLPEGRLTRDVMISGDGG